LNQRLEAELQRLLRFDPCRDGVDLKAGGDADRKAIMKTLLIGQDPKRENPDFLVPRLCPGTHCRRGSASNPPDRSMTLFI
jgi:hypothetical protein